MYTKCTFSTFVLYFNNSTSLNLKLSSFIFLLYKINTLEGFILLSVCIISKISLINVVSLSLTIIIKIELFLK